jgi:OFA family oxalate/formate antiporter-like MFS transporter
VDDVGLSRWAIIIASTAIMMVISIYQYSWSLFAYAVSRELMWSLITVSIAFTVFTYASTFIQPFSGFLADSYGPRKVAMIASIITGLGFILSSAISNPIELYITYGLGSLGVGTLYGIATATAVKWFPERRGLATGIVTFGFGAGASILNIPIQTLINSHGFRMTFLYIGLLMISLLTLLSLMMSYPKDITVRSVGKTSSKGIDYSPKEMLMTWQWYIIYLTFIITPTVVLIFGAQLKMIASEFSISQEYLNIVLISYPLANGFSRILAGLISDRIGRERTMVLFYTSLGISLLMLSYIGVIPELFVVLAIIISLFGGAPYTFYPSIIGDYYGSKYVTVNYGITYTAKAWAGLLAGWLTAYLVEVYGTYRLPLMIVAISCIIAALLSSPLILKPPKSKVISSK